MRQPFLPMALLAAAMAVSGNVCAHEGEPVPEGAPGRLGQVSFPISCTPDAQQEFNRAMAMLHSFFYPEAGRTFAKAGELDPGCAMAYWGVAMSWWYPLWYPPTRASLLQGKTAIDRARAIGAKSERERAYIEALQTFYDDFDQVDHRSRTAAYEQAMQSVHSRFPEDREAALLYALALQATADPNDKTYAHQLESARIIEQVFTEQPNHPGAAHYLIHAYDYPELAPRALPAARRYGEIAPAMPHALHMPSHTFIALGMWDESIRSNLAARQAAHELGWAQEEMHSVDYLAYAYLQRGQVHAAQDLRNRIAVIAIDDKARTLPFDYALAAVPARLALEQRQWRAATDLLPQPSRFPATKALTHYSRALGFARLHDVPGAEQEIVQLTQIRDGLVQGKQEYWAKQVEVQLETAQAWLAWASDDAGRAVELMRAAVALEESTYKHPITPGQLLPARELMGDMLMELGQSGAALTEYEATLRSNPNRFNALYGAARAAESAGLQTKAADYYRQLLAQCASADGERPELRHARQFVASR